MKFALLSSVAALALLNAGAASAQDATVAATEAAPAAAEASEIIILGHGQSRQTQTVRASDLIEVAPGTSPLKVMDKLPGVTFQSADPFGAYEWSTRISVRGFNQNQMGFTLDGVTLGDMSYGNYNGLHVSRAIINEDIARIDMAQGAGSLDSATSSNLGGTLKFVSRNPSEIMGGELAVTMGSDSMHRAYGRFETGAIDSLNGLRGFVSVADQKTDKWKGGGEQKQFQADTKWVLPVGEGDLTAFVNHSERREQDYQDLSFAMIDRLGYDWDNFQPDYAKAIGVASVLNNPANYYHATLNPTGTLDPASGYWRGTGTNPYATYGVENPDDAYYYGGGVRDDTLMALSFKTPLSDMVSVSGTVYNHQNEGQGLWVTPYTVSPNWGVAGATQDNAPLSIRTTEYDIDRTGFIGGINFDLGAHQVSAGLWVEDNDFNQARRFYAENLTAPKRDSLGFQENPIRTQWEYAFTTKTTQAYVQDTWTISEALKVNYGFKALSVENTVKQKVGGNIAAELKSEDSFLPQIGAVYELGNGYELFGSYSENMNAYVSAATSGPFSSQSQANIDFVRDNLKPETSKTLEGGLRVRNNRFQGVAALYSVDFDNRILAVAQGAGIIGNAPVLSNVGGVKTTGIELAGTFRITPEWKIYSAYSYNDSKYRNDVVAADGTIKARTKDKTVVNTPKNMLKSELSYDNGKVFGALSANFTGERYYTYENVGGLVEGSTIADLSVGYRFVDLGLTVQFNVTNLTDEQYISTIGSNGFVNSDAGGTSQTILTGAPRQMFVSLRKTF
ncbi:MULTISPECIES: TonB-dependent receptor [Asticcacaulis]|uniref:TonB-dependent receptor n=1 Tax=Asticcacaulis TaxID=76890 RepID=UPI001AE99A84|nr:MULTISPECIES: TonB-dependent receptor [Asticcacaulis]MBP2157743.1 iron complex outermembrane receptor protein [Asticcacaulis solisilvae]MDR6798788.1 iron complex outermembrane receptor protein [Asticcacaulis sp. BE141]